MDKETREKLKAAGLEGVVTAYDVLDAALKKEKTDRAAEAAAHAKAIKEKDAVIEQKNNDIVGARKQYKKLSEMTDAEKEQLSKAELELKEQMEQHDARVAQFETQQKELREKEVSSRRSAAIKKLVGNDAELAKKVEDNYGRIKDFDKAYTEEEVGKIVSEAFNMLGVPRKNVVNDAINNSGDGNPGSGGGDGYASTEAGKQLAGLMGIVVEAPPAQ